MHDGQGAPGTAPRGPANLVVITFTDNRDQSIVRQWSQVPRLMDSVSVAETQGAGLVMIVGSVAMVKWFNDGSVTVFVR